jgi:hypothetical protein
MLPLGLALNRYRNHPVIQRVGHRLSIPVGVHGDDAGAHGNEQVFTMTWGSVAAELPTLDSRVVFTMIKVGSMSSQTMHVLLRVLTWSLTALSEGVFPRADHTGREFSAEYYPKRAAMAGQPLANGA